MLLNVHLHLMTKRFRHLWKLSCDFLMFRLIQKSLSFLLLGKIFEHNAVRISTQTSWWNQRFSLSALPQKCLSQFQCNPVPSNTTSQNKQTVCALFNDRNTKMLHTSEQMINELQSHYTASQRSQCIDRNYWGLTRKSSFLHFTSDNHFNRYFHSLVWKWYPEHKVNPSPHSTGTPTPLMFQESFMPIQLIFVLWFCQVHFLCTFGQLQYFC